MTHELTTRENGFVEMAYTGETPWHGLGNVLEENATIEEWIEAAGMNWRALRSVVRYAVAHGATPESFREWPEKHVILRGDTLAHIGLVSKKFHIVQPRETIEFFRDLVGPAGGKLSTAGTLFDGAKFWAMARFGNDSSVADLRDTMRLNLLLATAIDGSMATTGTWIAERVVCNNTLQIGLGERGAVKVKVNHRSKFIADEVKAELGIERAQSAFERTVADMKRLASFNMAPQSVVLATAELFKPDFRQLDSAGQSKVLNSKPVQAIGRLALDGAAIGSEMAGTAGTAYGWLNAVTEYVDHAGRARTADTRLDSAWFGNGAELKTKAMAMAMAGVDGAAPDVVALGLLPAGDGPVASVNDWLSQHR